MMSTRRRLFIVLPLLAVSAGAAVLLWPHPSVAPEPVPTTSELITVTGTSGCLKHKDTSGPTTMECAFGITSDAGTSYALDLSSVDNGMGFETGQHMTIKGIFVPLAMISADRWYIYDIVGIIKVSEITPSE